MLHYCDALRESVVFDYIHRVIVGYSAVGCLVVAHTGDIAIVAAVGPERIDECEVEVRTCRCTAGVTVVTDVGSASDGIALGNVSAAEMSVEGIYVSAAYIVLDDDEVAVGTVPAACRDRAVSNRVYGGLAI